MLFGDWYFASAGWVVQGTATSAGCHAVEGLACWPHRMPRDSMKQDQYNTFTSARLNLSLCYAYPFLSGILFQSFFSLSCTSLSAYSLTECHSSRKVQAAPCVATYLPGDVWMHIQDYLTAKEWAKAAGTCKPFWRLPLRKMRCHVSLVSPSGNRYMHSIAFSVLEWRIICPQLSFCQVCLS